MNYSWLGEQLRKSNRISLLYRWLRAQTTGYSDWNSLLKSDGKSWALALDKSKNGKKILLATSIGLELAVTKLESVLGVALTLHNSSVHVLLCDVVLPACQACTIARCSDEEFFIKNGPTKDLCKVCFRPAETMYKKLGFKVHKYSEFLSAEDYAKAEKISSTLPASQIESYRFDGSAVGEHAFAGALRFFASATLPSGTNAEQILRNYFKASLLTTFAMRTLLNRIKFECVVIHHGIYVPQGLIGEVARKEGIRVATWNVSYKKKSFIFSHKDTYHHTFINEPVDKWEQMAWNENTEKELMDYLKSRWWGTNDWISFQAKETNVDKRAIVEECGLDPSKPCVGMLTNVMWDAQLHYPANAFSNMLEWVLFTIDCFSKKPEMQLLIRIHPAEIRGRIKSRQLVLTEIKKAFPMLPKNVFVISPQSSVNTYLAMSLCDAVIIYGTKTGVELASMGIPVIVAGEAWIRNKGISIDVSSKEEYIKVLERLPLKKKLDDKTLKRARKYAYHFFFRRMIPIEHAEPTGHWPPFKFRFKGFGDMQPGKDTGLDVICKGITDGSDFIFPSELSHCKEKILDLGCGRNKCRGALGVDFNKNTDADIIHDLNKFPYPFDDNEFDKILINHALEHLDNVVKVMEEIHRIAKPNALVLINAPYFTSIDAFADPTHRHFFSARSFDYFTDDLKEFSYYSDARFRKLKVEIKFWEWKKLRGFRLQNWMGLWLLANKLTKFYETFFAHIFPAKEIFYKLQVVK